MRVGQLSESDAVDALRLPFYSSRHARGSHVQGNQFDLGNTSLYGLSFRKGNDSDLQRRLRGSALGCSPPDFGHVASGIG